MRPTCQTTPDRVPTGQPSPSPLSAPHQNQSKIIKTPSKHRRRGAAAPSKPPDPMTGSGTDHSDQQPAPGAVRTTGRKPSPSITAGHRTGRLPDEAMAAPGPCRVSARRSPRSRSTRKTPPTTQVREHLGGPRVVQALLVPGRPRLDTPVPAAYVHRPSRLPIRRPPGSPDGGSGVPEGTAADQDKPFASARAPLPGGWAAAVRLPGGRRGCGRSRRGGHPGRPGRS